MINDESSGTEHETKPKLSLEIAHRPDGTEAPIETLLTSSYGRRIMNSFISEIDTAEDIPTTIETLISYALKDPDETIALLLSNDGKEALGRPELRELYSKNPAINRAVKFIKQAEYSGAVDTKRLYGDVMAILCQLVRYEALHGVYDPTGDIWQSREQRIGYHKGKQHTMHLPHRWRPPNGRS